MLHHITKLHYGLTILLTALLSLSGLPLGAQEKKLEVVPALQKNAGTDASVEITGVQILGGLPGGAVARSSTSNQRIAVQWNVTVPPNITLDGFDVVVAANLNNQQSLNQRQSFGANTRRAEFNFNLPSSNANGGANNGNAGGPQLGGNKDGSKEGNGGNPNGANPNAFDCKKCGTTTLAKDEFEFCRLLCNTSPPANPAGNPPAKVDCNAKCSRLIGAKKQTCLDDCLKSTTLETKGGLKKNFLSQNFLTGNRFVFGFAPQIQAQIKEPSPEKGVVPPAVAIATATATITARFSRRTAVSALRDFAPPATAPTGELAFAAPPNNRNQSNGVQIVRLIEILKLSSKAKECPAGHDCFDIIAEVRGSNVSGQFNVNLEALYPNNQRVSAPPVSVTTLTRPVSVNVRRPGNAAFVLATPSLNGATVESFTRTDSGTSQNQVQQILEKNIKK